MARKCYVNVQGFNREVEKIYVNVAGVNRVVTKAYINVAGVDRVWWPPTGGGVPPLSPGDYDISASSVYIPPEASGDDAWAEFDMSSFAGSNITAIAAKISWKSFGSVTANIYGRPSNTFYRGLTANNDFANRTIYHDLGSSAPPEFNSGSSIGYRLSGGINTNSTFISRLALRVTII